MGILGSAHCLGPFPLHAPPPPKARGAQGCAQPAGRSYWAPPSRLLQTQLPLVVTGPDATCGGWGRGGLSGPPASRPRASAVSLKKIRKEQVSGTADGSERQLVPKTNLREGTEVEYLRPTLERPLDQERGIYEDGSAPGKPVENSERRASCPKK